MKKKRNSYSMEQLFAKFGFWFDLVSPVKPSIRCERYGMIAGIRRKISGSSNTNEYLACRVERP